MHSGFLAEGVLDSHTQCYSLSVYSLLHIGYREMFMKIKASVSEAKVLRRFGADSLQQAGGLVLFNHIILQGES